MLEYPPLTQDKRPLAALRIPPLTEDQALPLAVLYIPPLTEDKLPLAVLRSPPLTEELRPLAVFFRYAPEPARYSLTQANCEHLAKYIVTGRWESGQVRKAVAGAALVGLAWLFGRE